MMLKTIAGIALAAGLAAPVAAQGYGPGPDERGYARPNRTVICESLQFRPNSCPADTSGGVELVRQLGNNACVRGRTWGMDPGAIWVTNGCRAVFETRGRPGWGGGHGGWPGGPGGGGYPGPGGGYPGGPGGPGRTVICASWQYQPARCAVDVYRGVDLVENISGSCNGRNWGWDRGGIWVNNGCRGRFRVY